MKTHSSYISVLLLLICISCLFVVSPVRATDYFVDVETGSNTIGDGLSSGTAWGTLHYAVTQINGLATPGHVLNVAPGTYSVNNPTNPSNLEVDAALTLTRSGVTIQGATDPTIDEVSRAVLVVEETCPGWLPGIEIDTSDVTIRNLVITGFSCDASGFGIDVSSGSNNRIESCVIENNDSGIYFGSNPDSIGNVVENCAIRNNTRYGIDIRDTSPQILSNTINDNMNGVAIDDYGNPQVLQNTMYNNINGVRLYDGSPEVLQNTMYDNAIGVNINHGNYQIIRPKIINNLIYTTGSGAYNMEQGIWAYASGGGSTIAAEIHHNTIVGGQFTGIYIEQADPDLLEAIDVKFNIITGFSVGVEEAVDSPSILVIDHNDVVNNSLYNYNNTKRRAQRYFHRPFICRRRQFRFSSQPHIPAAQSHPGRCRRYGRGRPGYCGETHRSWF